MVTVVAAAVVTVVAVAALAVARRAVMVAAVPRAALLHASFSSSLTRKDTLSYAATRGLMPRL